MLSYCLNMYNNLEDSTHMWSQSYFCGSSFRAVIDWQFFMPRMFSYTSSVPQWYKDNYKW